ncbi:MAG TPA: hypothetical protein VM513_03375 [Kofleriaceae bacterium]|jgi:hypothetical protein|nr:hypothetical protein [Kofleriaceae bacterium]
MLGPWQILRDGGLPLALPRSGARPSARELADAARAAIASGPSARDADALAAFLLAWEHHWPSSFHAALDRDAVTIAQWARAHTGDENRYLKLRRIALENLSTVL